MPRLTADLFVVLLVSLSLSPLSTTISSARGSSAAITFFERTRLLEAPRPTVGTVFEGRMSAT